MIKLKIILAWIIALFVIGIISIISFYYIYSQQYVQDSKTTATKGILFQQTLNLDHYKNVSNGNGWLGKFDRYSRSDRHGDVLTIYCKDFCKE